VLIFFFCLGGGGSRRCLQKKAGQGSTGAGGSFVLNIRLKMAVLFVVVMVQKWWWCSFLVCWRLELRSQLIMYEVRFKMLLHIIIYENWRRRVCIFSLDVVVVGVIQPPLTIAVVQRSKRKWGWAFQCSKSPPIPIPRLHFFVAAVLAVQTETKIGGSISAPSHSFHHHLFQFHCHFLPFEGALVYLVANGSRFLSLHIIP
jgi:hypothetical protein